jgi:ABC-2 type transport system ATP-binding protein
MNIIAPSQGRAEILGTDSRRISPREMAQIGYVSENQMMPAQMTVEQYIAYLRPFYPTWDRALESEHLAQLRLPPDRKIGHLSHGMRMKMALACALPFRPKLLILDDPFSGMDPLARDEFIEGLLQQAGEMTIFVSSHELSEVETFATDVGFLDDGKMLFEESLDTLNARLRAVRLVLDREAAVTRPGPETWLDLKAGGNVLTFVETQYREADFAARVGMVIPGVQTIDVQPVALRSMFTALARSTRKGRAA